jgi:ATP-dependent DNA helicase RecG
MTTPDDERRISFTLKTTADSDTVVTLPADTPPEAVARTLVALANSNGGTVRLNAAENTPPAELGDRIVKAALSLEPPLIMPLPAIQTPDEDANTHEPSSTVVVRVPAGMPHVYSYNGQYLIRHNSQNQPLAAQQLRQLLLQRGEISFETQPVPGTSLEHIDWQKAKAYTQSLISRTPADADTHAQQMLLQRGCLIHDNDTLRPTYAGLLLFGHDPQRYLINSDMTAARFAGDTMSDTFQREDIGGTLPQQIKRAETFLIDHLRKAVTLRETMQRDEQYEYPMEAARELVINAVAHRDYNLRGDNIRLFIFSNRFEVHSPGVLPGPMTLANLQEERFSRNPVIVQVLSDMHFIEKLGYGLNRVMHLMQSNDLPEPVFQERSGSFQVTLFNAAIKPLAPPKSTDTLETASTAEPADSTGTDHLHPSDTPDDKPQPTPVTQQSVVIGGLFRGHEVNQRQEKALNYLHQTDNTRITNSDLKEFFPDVHPETIRRDLVDLVDKHILKKMGQKRGSYYVLQPEPDTPEPGTDEANSHTSGDDKKQNDT